MYRGMAFRERDLNKLAIGVKLKKSTKIKRSFASCSFTTTCLFLSFLTQSDCHSSLFVLSHISLANTYTHDLACAYTHARREILLRKRDFFLRVVMRMKNFLKHLLTLCHCTWACFNLNEYFKGLHNCVCVWENEREREKGLNVTKVVNPVFYNILLFSSTSCLPVCCMVMLEEFLFASILMLASWLLWYAQYSFTYIAHVCVSYFYIINLYYCVSN